MLPLPPDIIAVFDSSGIRFTHLEQVLPYIIDPVSLSRMTRRQRAGLLRMLQRTAAHNGYTNRAPDTAHPPDPDPNPIRSLPPTALEVIPSRKKVRKLSRKTLIERAIAKLWASRSTLTSPRPSPGDGDHCPTRVPYNHTANR